MEQYLRNHLAKALTVESIYISVPHFNALFCQFWGVSPREYRRKSV